MCTAFKELFQDEILEAERNGERQGRINLIFKLVKEGKLSKEDGAEEMQLPLSDFELMLSKE